MEDCMPVTSPAHLQGTALRSVEHLQCVSSPTRCSTWRCVVGMNDAYLCIDISYFCCIKTHDANSYRT